METNAVSTQLWSTHSSHRQAHRERKGGCGGWEGGLNNRKCTLRNHNIDEKNICKIKCWRNTI